MEKNNCMDKRVTDEWVRIFGESIGIQERETEKLTQDRQSDRISMNQKQEMRCKCCNKMIPVEQDGNSSRKSNRCKECSAEALTSQEDVEEIIDSCLCVLDKVYEIKVKCPVSVKLRHRRKGTPVRIKGSIVMASGQEVGEIGKKGRRLARKNKRKKTVSIAYETPRIQVILFFVKQCFQNELEGMYGKGVFEKSTGERSVDEKGQVEKGSKRQKNKNARNGASQNSTIEKSPEEDERILAQKTAGIFLEEKAQSESSKMQGDPGKRQTEDEPEESERLNPAIPREMVFALLTWLVANCLHTMGELVYAQQYIADYQEDSGKKNMSTICNIIGIPWNVAGNSVREVVKKLDSGLSDKVKGLDSGMSDEDMDCGSK